MPKETKEQKTNRKLEAAGRLLDFVPKGTRVYHLKGKKPNQIRLFVVWHGEILEITRLASIVGEMSFHPDRGITRKGSGYGYGSDCVEILSYALYDSATALRGQSL